MSEDGLKLVVFLILIFGLLFVGYFAPDTVAYYCTKHKVIVGTVVDKYVKRYDDKDVFFVVVKTDDGKRVVLQNTDCPIAGKWNSADVQASIDVGKKYEFVVYGWRIPLFSVFPNILKVEPVR